MDVFKTLAAILHLGNVQITAVGSEQSAVSVRGWLVSLSVLGGSSAGCLRIPLLLHFSTRNFGPTGETRLTGKRKEGFPWVAFEE